MEYWFLKGENFNASAALGAHITDYKGGGDSKGIDAALLASTRPAKNLEIYGGLMLAFDSVKNGSGYNGVGREGLDGPGNHSARCRPVASCAVMSCRTGRRRVLHQRVGEVVNQSGCSGAPPFDATTA